MKQLAWVNVVLGVWLIVAPYVLGYSTASTALWNDIIIGVVVAIVALVGALGGQKSGAPGAM